MADVEPDSRGPAVPDGMPVLSRGKHRRPADGGCFMEFASYLAGERWSDHPDCTHPLLASLARLVNDATSDRGRARLAPLVPSVVGLQSHDLRLHALVARRCALVALPVAPPDEQRALAVAVLAAERVLAREEARDPRVLGDEARAVLAAAPDAHAWAAEFADREVPRPRPYRRHAAPTAVRCAVQGILASGPSDPDALLYDLLATAVDEARAFTRHDVAPVDAARWTAGCDLLEVVAAC